jgi:hypothetical protein
MRATWAAKVAVVAMVAGAVGILASRHVTEARAQVGQQTQQPTVPPAQLPGNMNADHGLNAGPSVDENDPQRARMLAQAVKMGNEDRHKRLEADTDKLLALSTELKADVDKAKKDELSMDVIRKAAEIEKLAHDVKERMKS